MAFLQGVGVSGTLTYGVLWVRFAHEDLNPLIGEIYKPIMIGLGHG